MLVSPVTAGVAGDWSSLVKPQPRLSNAPVVRHSAEAANVSRSAHEQGEYQKSLIFDPGGDASGARRVQVACGCCPRVQAVSGAVEARATAPCWHGPRWEDPSGYGNEVVPVDMQAGPFLSPGSGGFWPGPGEAR